MSSTAGQFAPNLRDVSAWAAIEARARMARPICSGSRVTGMSGSRIQGALKKTSTRKGDLPCTRLKAAGRKAECQSTAGGSATAGNPAAASRTSTSATTIVDRGDTPQWADVGPELRTYAG